MNTPPKKDSSLLQKAKNQIKITNIQKNSTYINTDLYILTYTLIGEYIENISKECELAKRFDALDFQNSLIPTQ